MMAPHSAANTAHNTTQSLSLTGSPSLRLRLTKNLKYVRERFTHCVLLPAMTDRHQ